MDKDDWTELTAQIEDHGVEAVNFYLSGADEHGHDLWLQPTSIRFEDNEIKVVLE